MEHAPDAAEQERPDILKPRLFLASSRTPVGGYRRQGESWIEPGQMLARNDRRDGRGSSSSCVLQPGFQSDRKHLRKADSAIARADGANRRGPLERLDALLSAFMPQRCANYFAAAAGYDLGERKMLYCRSPPRMSR